MTALFSPKHIGAVEIPNRVVMAAMTTRLADSEGFVTEGTVAYFSARAEGGTGLITVEMASPEKVGRHRFHELGIYDDRFIPGLTRLTRTLHARGAKASIQLGHAGGHTREDICGEPPIAPSAVPHYVFELRGETVTPLAMTHARIADTTLAFVAAARRAQAAGFDCIEIHAAHGYLLSQFMCPEENHRTDEYGGAIANRARLSLEILRAVKAALPGLPVIVRLNADDYFPHGLIFEDALRFAKWAAAEGADALHVTAGHYRSQPSAHMMTPPMSCGEGVFLDYAARVKAAVSVPVIAVGRLGYPEIAMAAVDTGKADFVALGRPLIADPGWVSKARRGSAVRRCLSCNTCVDEMRGGDRLGCIVNPAAASEIEYGAGEVRAKGERICVIGAGPAGLTYAALVADGNAVTVFDKALRGGGALRHAGLAPRFQNVEASQDTLDAYVDGLERACCENGVMLRYGTTVSDVRDVARDFDRIVIATGARYRFGLGPLVTRLLEAGWGKSNLARRVFNPSRVRNWFYYRGRESIRPKVGKLIGKPIVIIGDAAAPGKTRDATVSAFKAALFQGGAST